MEPRTEGRRVGRPELHVEQRVHRDAVGRPSRPRLAVLYDAPGGMSVSHMKRDIGLAWLDLPLKPPDVDAGQ
jgi:hypothetical protein